AGYAGALLVVSPRLDRGVQHPELLDVHDELLVAGDERRLEPSRRVHDEVRAGEEGGPERYHRIVARPARADLRRRQRAAAAERQVVVPRDLAGAEETD